MKKFVHSDTKSRKNEAEEQKINSNNFLDFNPNIGLKARLYQKNKELMDRVFSDEGSIQNSEKRDFSRFNGLVWFGICVRRSRKLTDQHD
jgi:hypothetical protein